MTIRIDDKAPEFTLLSDEKKPVSLKSYLGRKVVLYFYPKDYTPGCTAQACDLRNNFAAIQKEKAVVLGVSLDSPDRHHNFKNSFGLPYPLLSDKDASVCHAYGVINPKNALSRSFLALKRTTVVIDEEGNIQALWRNVGFKKHAEAVLAEVAQSPKKILPTDTVESILGEALTTVQTCKIAATKKSQEAQKKLLQALTKLQEKTLKDLSNKKLTIDEAKVLANQTRTLALRICNPNMKGNPVKAFENSTAAKVKTQAWKVILGLVIGAAIGFILGAMLGALAGPAIALALGTKGAIIGASVGAVIGGYAGGKIGFWQSRSQDRLVQVAKAAEHFDKCVHPNPSK